MEDLDVESVRDEILRQTGLLEPSFERAFDRFTQLATKILQVPVALVSLIDHKRQFFKSQCGLPKPWSDLRQTPLTHSFCQYVVERKEALIVEDARLDPVLCDNLAIPELGVIAYAGIPILAEEGVYLGSFCAIDSKPKAWSDDDIGILRDLATAVESEIKLRLELYRRTEAENAYKALSQNLEEEVRKRTQEISDALDSSRSLKQRFRILIERVPQAVAMMDREMRYLAYSRRWIEDYRLPADIDLVGKCHYDIFPGVPERWKEHHRRVLNGESLKNDEDFFTRDNGEEEWVRWELVPWTSQGEVGGLIMITEVLTERRKEQARTLLQFDKLE